MALESKIKTDWCAALRSGNYLQGQGLLRDSLKDSYCCLGVLCSVMGAEFTEFTAEGLEDGEPIHTTFGNVPVLNEEMLSLRDDEELSPKTLDSLGLTKDQQLALVRMNDGYSVPGNPDYQPSCTFGEIADYIEANL